MPILCKRKVWKKSRSPEYGIPGQVDLLAGQVTFKSYLPNEQLVQTNHRLTKSLTKRSKEWPGQTKCENCLPNGQCNSNIFRVPRRGETDTLGASYPGCPGYPSPPVSSIATFGRRCVGRRSASSHARKNLRYPGYETDRKIHNSLTRAPLF